MMVGTPCQAAAVCSLSRRLSKAAERACNAPAMTASSVCIHVWIRMCMRACASKHTYMHDTHMRTHAHTTHTHTHKHIHTRAHTHTRTHIHTRTQRLSMHKHACACTLWATQGVRFSPTFAIFSPAGRKVDEVLGKEPQRLADHLWLHSDD